MEITIKEIEAVKLNLQPGEVLAIQLRGPDFMDESVIHSFRDQIQKLFPNNKVFVMSMNDGHEITFNVLQPKEQPVAASCKDVGYCSDCNCGKKAAALGEE